MKYLSLNIGGQPINAPSTVPTGGFVKFEEILRVGLTALFIVAFVLALIFLIWGGIQWTMSGGDKEGIQKARLKLTYAIIGLVVTTLAFFIVNIISGFFGFNFFT